MITIGHDNDSINTGNLVNKSPKDNDINVLPWPAMNTDINPREKVQARKLPNLDKFQQFYYEECKLFHHMFVKDDAKYKSADWEFIRKPI